MEAFIVLTQKIVLWRRNRDQTWSPWEWGGRRDGGEQRLSCGGVPISWPRGLSVTEPWGPHRFILSSVSLTVRVRSLCATTNFVCTVRFYSLNPVARTPRTRWLCWCLPGGEVTYLFLGPVNQEAMTRHYYTPTRGTSSHLRALPGQAWNTDRHPRCLRGTHSPKAETPEEP